MSDNDSAELSWPESDTHESILPITPRAERIGDVLGKRKREESPITPVHRRVNPQLDTPPNSSKRLSKRPTDTNVTPSKGRTLDDTQALVNQVDHQLGDVILGKALHLTESLHS